ncbi:MAG: AAA family ATPase [Acidimicrobiales bacterium]
MPTLLLLNGPPGAGKSTLASRLVARSPLALNLDIDIVRHQLGGWLDQPTEAGLAARHLASAMTNAHLSSGYDVVVPQFLARIDFVEQLERLAATAGATFVEVELYLDRGEALAAFQSRSVSSENRYHQDAQALLDRSDAVDPLGDMYDNFRSFMSTRPKVPRVDVIRGDVEATVRALLRVLDDVNITW